MPSNKPYETAKDGEIARQVKLANLFYKLLDGALK